MSLEDMRNPSEPPECRCKNALDMPQIDISFSGRTALYLLAKSSTHLHKGRKLPTMKGKQQVGTYQASPASPHPDSPDGRPGKRALEILLHGFLEDDDSIVNY